MNAQPGPKPALPLLLISGLAVLATGEPEKPQLSIEHHGASQQVGLQWQAEPDAVYLLRHKADLRDAEWTGKHGMQGAGESHTATLDAAGSRGFYRVERHDLSSAALALDPDRDTISTLLEVLGGTNPFLNRDANTNLLPDDWEAFYSVDDPQADSETPPDGLNAYREYQAGTDPNFSNPVSADSDGAAMLAVWRQLR